MATLAGRNLPAKARALGLNVIELPGWESRGESDGLFSVFGVILHHDGMGLGYVDTNLGNNMNVAEFMSQQGNDGSQLWIGLDRRGRMVLVFMAAGRKWHAGVGSGFRAIPADEGNSTCAGIETDHTFGTPWTAELVHYIDVTTRLLCDEFGIDPDRWLAGHKEYAPGRKPDPENFDCEAWRQRVKNLNLEEDMPLSDADVEKVANAVMEKMKVRSAVTGNVYGHPQMMAFLDANTTKMPHPWPTEKAAAKKA